VKKPLNDIQKDFFKEMTQRQDSSDALGAFHIYQNAYRIRIREAITDDFAKSLVGISPELADELFEEFFATSFSESFTLNAIGFVWMEFLRNTTIVLPQWFMELSHFEWELTLALYKESDSQFTPREVTLTTPDTNDAVTGTSIPKVHLAPAVTLLEYDFPIPQIYGAEDQYSYVTQIANEVDSTSKHKVVCWRRDDESFYSGVSEFSFGILQKFLQGKSLIEITNDFYTDESISNDHLAHEIQSAFAELSSLGILTVTN
jgi:hypothetical protein